MQFKTTPSAVLMLIASMPAALFVQAIPSPGSAPGDAVQCGVDGLKLSTNNVDDRLDAKVFDCPWGNSWERCCNKCGTSLQNQGKLKSGWFCCTTGSGVWLKGSVHERCKKFI